MGLNMVKKLRAQRKFAQGAFVPTPNTPSTSGPPPVTLHAPQRLVSGSAPTPSIVLNQCSPRDLVTHMSLRSLDTTYRIPIVVLERTDFNITNKDNSKRKLKEKKNARTSGSKRHPTNTSNPVDERRVSVSDSGEDAPLSNLLISPVASSSPDKTTDLNRQEQAASSQLVNPDVMLVNPQENIPCPSESHGPSVSAHERSSFVSSAGNSRVSVEHPLERGPPSNCRCSNPLFNQNKCCCILDPSDFNSVSPPTFKASTASSERSKRINTLKRKASNKTTSQNNKKKKKTLGLEALVDEDFTSDTNSELNMSHDDPNLDSREINSEMNMSETNVRNIPSTTNSITTAMWIKQQSENFTSTAIRTVRRSPVPGCSSLDNIKCLGPTIPGGEMLVAECENDRQFKKPKVPTRSTKRIRDCPTRSCNDLKQLLESESNSLINPLCNSCNRCELKNKCKKVASQLPVSLADDPDILEQRPRDIYEFDSDEGGMKYLRRGRELVRNVLTTNKFPIWLCNLEMNLHMGMFHKEHQLGTLKRNIIFPPNDVADDMVKKIIWRVDYLERCIAEDNKELEKESKKSRKSKSARSSARSSRKPPNNNLTKVVKPRRKPRQMVRLPMDTELPTPLPPASPTVLASNVSQIADHLELRREGSVTPSTPAPTSSSTPIQDRMMPQGSLSTEIAQSSAPKSQPLSERVNTPMAQSSNSEKVSFIAPLTQIESADCPLPNLELQESDSDASSDLLLYWDEDHSSDTTPTPAPDPETSDLLIFRPTLDEFKDPITYIKSIEKEASKYGIIKIIPPEPLNIPCHLDENVVFETVNQHLGHLLQRWGTNSSEMVTIQNRMAMLSPLRAKEQLIKVPLFDGVELDLLKLYKLVLDYGGIQQLYGHDEKWARIAEHMSLSTHRGKPDLKKLEKLYCKHVLPYESLSSFERREMRHTMDKLWKLRLKDTVRRAKSPLHNQRRLLGYTASDVEEETITDARMRSTNQGVMPFFERIENCTSKGRNMNLATFRRIAAQIEAMRYSTMPDTVNIEADYWKILGITQDYLCVLTACIDTSVDKLGHTSDPAAPGGSHPWNLKRLSDNPLNVLRWLGKALSVTVPTLTLGQLYSTNFWHRDPHKLAWLDYMHEGAAKIWYGVPSSGGRAFRDAVECLNPSAVRTKRLWLASDTTMIPPGSLMERGVPMHRIVQRPGEFIVVFPGAYACSIGTGLSISESIYFEGHNWLENIDEIFRDLNEDCEPTMFSNTLLLMRMARESTLQSDVLQRVYNSLSGLFRDEFECRREAVMLKCWVQIDKNGRADSEQEPISWPNQEECSICRVPLILSKMYLSDEARSLMCLTHGLRLMSLTEAPVGAEPPNVTLLYSNEELKKIISDLEVLLLDKITPACTETV